MSTPLFPSPFLGPSHRTIPEQLVGLGIFLFISLGMCLLNGTFSSFEGFWFQHLFLPSWAAFAPAAFPLCSPLSHALLSLSMWTLWRRISLRKLKWETSLFCALIFFFSAWHLNFFFFRETWIALVTLLIQMSLVLLAILLFWKKERFSGQLLVLPFLWSFYVMGMNMAICIYNP